MVVANPSDQWKSVEIDNTTAKNRDGENIVVDDENTIATGAAVSMD